MFILYFVNNLSKENVNYLCEHIQDYLQKYTKLLVKQIIRFL